MDLLGVQKISKLTRAIREICKPTPFLQEHKAPGSTGTIYVVVEVMDMIVVSIIIFALYKTKSFGKFRLFKGKIEDVKKENNEIRRRSQMRISNKTSAMYENFD